jgi:hypothetical protein
MKEIYERKQKDIATVGYTMWTVKYVVYSALSIYSVYNSVYNIC